MGFSDNLAIKGVMVATVFAVLAGFFWALKYLFSEKKPRIMIKKKAKAKKEAKKKD